MAVGLVIVSHSERLAAGIVELASQMAHNRVRLVAAGGTDDGSLGTSLTKVLKALDEADSAEGVLVLIDLGSSGLVAEMALEQLPADRRAQVQISGAPLVEGAIAAAVEAAIGSSLKQVAATAEEAAAMHKSPKRT
jgi:phosphoenolpyruvate---glycerone phosphotransferase subunit DhaM